MRVVYTGEPLPQDRESVFYLNVLYIPPKPTEAETKGQSYLQMSIRSRIKFFFRPALAMDIADAPQQVKWTLNGETLTATNPTPYHITFSNVEAIGQAEPASVEKIGMVKPFDTLDFSIKNAQGAKNIKWQIINDYGGYQDGETPLQ
ncbi:MULTISPECIES: molecular chaperone [unclassified Moraxella]|uniref:fimbrial biogenesis chaperone n=1 Tax=unclassified Moraxella TaxID=2685852 RepID=UPI00359D8040